MSDNTNYSYKVTKTTTQTNGGSSNFLGFLKKKTPSGTTTTTTTTTYVNAERNGEIIQNSQSSHTTYNGTCSKPPLAGFRQLMLEHHNIIRHKHGANFMRLSNEMNDHAQEWAEKLAKRNELIHRPGGKYGENIFQFTSNDPQAYPMAERVCEKFYEEMNGYPFGSDSYSAAFNFTQMVWNDSIELGVGMAKAKDGSVYVVCNYSPRGNVIGEYNKNVFQPGHKRVETVATRVVTPAACRPVQRSNFNIKPDCTKSAPPPTQKFTSSNSSLDDFRRAALNHHNILRKKHGASPMRLSEEINAYAQDWANTLASENRFYHRPNGKYGENIYTSFSSDPNNQPSGEQAIQSFYDEIKDYRFGGEPRNFSQVGHFTQVVWDTSVELGVGMAKSSRGSHYVVCNYSPRGNMMGSFAQHVSKPLY